MDKAYLKKNNLYECHKQFMRLCEYTFAPTTLEEDDDDIDNNNDEMGNDIDPMGADNAPMGGDAAPMGDETAPMGNGDDNPMGDDEIAPMDDTDNAPMDDDMPIEDPVLDDTADVKNDDNVIDVDDIVDAQETVNDKVNSVGRNLGQVDDKIQQLLQSLNKIESMLDSNNQRISELETEFNKRNPTPTEKLNLRSLDSYPFNVRPDDYWKSKNANSNYDVYGDNNEPTSEENLSITNSDVDNFNEREIANSFFPDEDMKQDLKKIFGY